MNRSFFDRHLKELFEILDQSTLSAIEIRQRKQRLEQCVKRIAQDEKREDYDRYNQLAHEIESYAFLAKFGTVKMAEDSKHQAGCDFVLSDSIYIECVCSSAGDIEKSGLAYYMGEGFFDYSKKSKLLNERFISSLCAKVDFYNERKGKSILPDMPYVIFLSPGNLIYEWFEESHGIALLDVLLGRGNPTISVNTKTGEMVDSGYSHRAWIEKHNGAVLDCNLFTNPDFNCVSAILLCTVLGERYSEENTFLFKNPFALNPVDEGVLKNTVCWKLVDGKEYASFSGGKRLG